MKRIVGLLSLLIVCAICTMTLPAIARRSGGSGGGNGRVDTIRVSKCFYADTGSYVELLINANSSDTTAHLFAYLPSGAYLGEVQNGRGGRYGGTVFLTLTIPATITINSSKGGSITVPCTPYQP